jgi:hypothetical protein
MGCNPCRPQATYVNVAFDSGLAEVAQLSPSVRGLHGFLTVCMGCNPCRPQATYVNVDFAVGEP